MKKPVNDYAASSVIIVFGRTAESKVARGARFRIEDREKALAAAMDRNFELLMASDDATRRLAEELAEGRFAVNGRAQLPAIAPALYDRLRAHAASTPEEEKTMDAPQAPEKPTNDPAANSDADEFEAAGVGAAERMQDPPGSQPPDVSTASERADIAAEAESSARPEGSAQPQGVAANANSVIEDASSAAKSAAADQEPSGSVDRGREPALSTEDAAKVISGGQVSDDQQYSIDQRVQAPTASASEPSRAKREGAFGNSDEAIAPAAVVFGRIGTARPRAGWHPLIEAGLARRAAEQQSLQWLPIATSDEYRIASQIGRGKLFGHGTLFAPAVSLALFEKLVQLYERAQSEGRTEHGLPLEPTGRRRPPMWEAIGVGSLVLAPEEKADEGWWEAEVLAMTGDELALRWIVDPQAPVFVRTLEQIALLDPDRASAV